MEKKEIKEIKETLRRQGLSKRNSMSAAARSMADKKILQRVFETKQYRQAELLLVYVNYKSEVDTKELIQRAFLDGKRVAVPKVLDKNGLMEFYEISSLSQLKKGYQGIEEPITDGKKLVCVREEIKQIANGKCILMILPGAAFDSSGNRIGYGGGFYDRYLEKYPNRCFYTMAVCYQVQLVPDITMDGHDYPVDMIVTEKVKVCCNQ